MGMNPQNKLKFTVEAVEASTIPPKAPSLVMSTSSRNKAKTLPRVELTPTAYTQYLKPAGDRIAALCTLVVLAIPMACVAGAVAQSMGRPIIFSQRRVGLNGKIFNVLKFRTMGPDRRAIKTDDVEPELRLTHKSDDDPRHTHVGRILRKLSLDELPQLINILRGEMSVVGPRPELEAVVAEKYPENLHQRHLVRPGLVGLWQISARGHGPMHENGEWDLEYIEKVSLLTDIKIICKTPRAMFGGNKGS